jgi:UDP-N-acetylmuramoyl-tripeptide--D-alanyl-D-alanine ligase
MMARAVLARHKPKVVAITGSVGKTSANTAIFSVLSTKFRVRDNQKNYNNETGVPLTIIGTESGGKNLLKWFRVFTKWLSVLVSSDYPDILVLELGVDRIGDMNYFMSFIKPTVGVVTNISSSHLEYFQSVDNIAKEKGLLVEALDPGGFALLNADDPRVVQMMERTQAQVINYGMDRNAEIWASDITYCYRDGSAAGISFSLNHAGGTAEIRLPNMLAAHQAYAVLAGMAAGIVFKIDLADIISALEPFKSPAGRMNLLEGRNGSSVIDDTYNASQASTVAALSVLGELKTDRKLAVLGDMLELGVENESGHRVVGQKVFTSKVDIFVAVGKRMEIATSELISLGFPAPNILQFADPDSAAEGLVKLVKRGDLILVKGSQGMRMEKVVESLLAEPGQASNVLCRQSKGWKKIPFAPR